MAAFTLRYARAFQQVAAAQNLSLDAVRTQLHDFSATLGTSRDLREFLMNPSLQPADKLKVLDAVALRIGIHQAVRNFIAVVMDHQRLNALDEIIAEYEVLADREKSIADVEIVSALPLEGDQRELLKSKAGELAGSNVRVTWLQDASLLGGAIIRLGSRVYDGSVRGQLEQMQHHLAGV